MNLMSWLNSAFLRLNTLRGTIRRIPGVVGLGAARYRLVLGAAGLGLAVFWFHQHDARVRQKALAGVARRETATEVSALKKQAEADVQAANVANAQAIQKLEASRQELERQNQQLTARLGKLRTEEQAATQQVATLPTSEVVTRVAAQLGLQAQDLAPRSGDAGAIYESSLRNSDGAFPVAGLGGTKTRDTEPSVAATRAKGDGGDAVPNRTVRDAAATDKVSVLPLSASGARKVETALVELNSCQSEQAVEEQEITNCGKSAATDAATIRTQASSIGNLNQALKAKDQILEREQAEYQAELRAARGTFWGRLARTSEHVAIGIALGVAVGAAVR